MILVLNAGSSSLKAAVFTPELQPVLTGAVTGVGGRGTLRLAERETALTTADHAAALSAMRAALAEAGYGPETLTAAAHRVVHGGTRFTAPARVTEDVIAGIRACFPLAPLHNPNNLAGITALMAASPDLPQYCSFGTAFHATNPDVATRYAIPETEAAKGIRRYGFHGLSYANMVATWDGPLPSRLLALHLGNGASLCAIKDGRSVATSMGYSPLSGLTMGTRSGEIDGAAVLRMAEDHGAAQTDRLLNTDSGLKALAGTNDMRSLLTREDAAARFAVDHFCYWAARHAGSAAVAMGGVDAVAFTGGIGENAAPVRARIMDHLSFLGDLPVHVIKADEALAIARDAKALMDRGA